MLLCSRQTRRLRGRAGIADTAVQSREIQNCSVVVRVERLRLQDRRFRFGVTTKAPMRKGKAGVLATDAYSFDFTPAAVLSLDGIDGLSDIAVERDTLVAGGRVVGTWSRAEKPTSIHLTAMPFTELGTVSRSALAAAARRYGRFKEKPVELVYSRV